jgi:hypothetical protein
MSTTPDFWAERKGFPIRFCAGKYKGRLGWMDKKNASTKCMHSVLVIMDELGEDIYVTRVMKESVGDRFHEPESYIQAALQQHEDILGDMDRLAKKLAECRIEGTEEILHIFKKKVDDAFHRQLVKGNKAKWRSVDFEGKPESDHDHLD